MPCYAKLEGKTYTFPTVEWYREGVGYVLENDLIENYDRRNGAPEIKNNKTKRRGRMLNCRAS